MRPLRGILPPVVTPFDSDGALDLAAFEANLEAWAGEDLEGYVVLGSNGEAASLEEDEKLALVRAARARAGGRALLVGTGLDSTRATIALTRRVADLGADAVLVLTPYYYKPQMTAEVLRRHFLAVAEASPVPVYLYSMTLFTGVPWPPGLAADLASHPRIAGIKESSSDLGLLGRIITSVPARFEVACGSAPVLYPALCLGACAGVLAVANCAPALAVIVKLATSSLTRVQWVILGRASRRWNTFWARSKAVRYMSIATSPLAWQLTCMPARCTRSIQAFSSS